MSEAFKLNVAAREVMMPTFKIEHAGNEYVLHWGNTYIQTYETGNSELDKELAIYQHVVVSGLPEGQFLAIVFEKLEEGTLDFLWENQYERRVSPEVHPYILQGVSERIVNTMPDAPDPNFAP